MCATLHVLWSLIYITCGAVQLVVGIFFLVAKFDALFLRLGSNVIAGGWNVVVGVTGALVACVGPMSSPGRHEALLYMAVSVLAVNAVNLAVLEIVEWKMLWTDYHREIAERDKLTGFLMYARIGTSAAAVVAMLVSFLDSQLTFCSLQHAVHKRLSRRRSSKGAHGHHHHGHHGHHHDHSADSEYIILPRVRPSAKNGYEQYTRSWVFDVDGNGAGGGGGGGGSGGGGSSARYQQLDSHSHADKCRDAAAAAVAAAEGRSVSSRASSTQRGDTYTVADAKAIRAAIANGGPPADASPAPSGPSGSKQYSRQQKHKELMREREHQKQLREQQQHQGRQRPRPASTSSAASSGAGGGASPASSSRQPQHQPHPPPQHQPVIEESPPSGTSPDSPAVDSAESRSPDSGELADQDGVGYHSLMSELTQVIRKKPSPKDDTSSADFNRQLEAALQDIHDLDSSTGGTLVNASSAASSSAPPPPAPDWGDSDDESSASNRTVGKRRSHPRLGRAFAIPVPPPVPPPGADGCGTLRGTLRATRTGTLTNTLRRQWDRELQQLQQQRDSAQTSPSPEPPPPPPPPPQEQEPAYEAPLQQSPVRSKTVVTICDGGMVVREMNNNDIVLVPAVLPLPLPPDLDELPPAPPAIQVNGSRELPPVSSPSPSPPPSPSPTPSPAPPPEAGLDPDLGDEPAVSQGCSMGSVGRLGGLSLLRKGRSRSRSRRSSSGCGVRLSQELQGAVLQSESLVFLTDSELVARHERNRRVQREIEQRVQQQISGHSGGDSLC